MHHVILFFCCCGKISESAARTELGSPSRCLTHQVWGEHSNLLTVKRTSILARGRDEIIFIMTMKRRASHIINLHFAKPGAKHTKHIAVRFDKSIIRLSWNGPRSFTRTITERTVFQVCNARIRWNRKRRVCG